MSAELVPFADPILGHSGAWTEEDFLALPEDELQRVELIEGALLVSPHGDVGHQQIASRLWRELDVALPDDIVVVTEANVRLPSGSIPIPDLVVTTDLSEPLVLDASEVLLVAEIVSETPPSQHRDRVEKPALYAAAGIPWYLRVERQPVLELILFRLDGGAYVEHARVRTGSSLEFPSLEVSVEVDALARRR